MFVLGGTKIRDVPPWTLARIVCNYGRVHPTPSGGEARVHGELFLNLPLQELPARKDDLIDRRGYHGWETWVYGKL